MPQIDTLDKSLLARVMMYRALGWTQAEIADELDVSQSTVSRYGKVVREASILEKKDILLFFLPLLMGGLAAAFGFGFWKVFSRFRP